MNNLRRWALAAAIILSITFSAVAQTYTHRGFLESRGTVYPRKAVNDSARAVGESLFRYEGFLRPSNTFQVAGMVDLRTDTDRQVERDFKFSWQDREIQRPIGTVRRLSATLHGGPLTLEVGKQFIRWGKTDIVTPTDRFAPRDFLTVVDNEFLAITAGRLTLEKGPHTLEMVWSPRFTPSRIPLAGKRWAPVPQTEAPLSIPEVNREFPGGPQSGIRWGYAGPIEFEASLYQGFNNMPSFDIGPRGDVDVFYPKMIMGGVDFAIPTRLFTIKGEAAHFSSQDKRADEYGLYVLQLERQSGEWVFIGGYAGEAITRRGSQTATFAYDRGLSQTFLGRASYTLDSNRSLAFESAVRQNANGFWVKGEYSQAFGQHWRVTLSMTGIAGDADDFLGQYNRNHHGIVVVRYSF